MVSSKKLLLSACLVAALTGCAIGPKGYTFGVDDMVANEDGTVTLKAPELNQYLKELAVYEAALKNQPSYLKPGEPGGPSGPPKPTPKPTPTPKPPYPKPPAKPTGPGPEKPGQVVIWDF